VRHASAMAEKVIDGRKLVIQVRVAVDRPQDADQSYIRCVDEHHRSAAGAGAWSGARFARHRVDRDYFQIDILEINGNVDAPEAGMGAAVASVAATWIAYGVDWTDAELGDTHGWSLRRPVG
jgi:hypothetical protein